MTAPNMSDPRDVLARTIWAEARNQGREGMEAVAAVIMNRASNPRWWGHDVIGVCTHPWQFTCWRPEPVGQLAHIRNLLPSDPAYRTAYEIAGRALAHTLPDPTKGADSYANLKACWPSWVDSHDPVQTIGDHTFFRLELKPPVHDLPEARQS